MSCRDKLAFLKTHLTEPPRVCWRSFDFTSRRHNRLWEGGIVGGFRGWDVADGLQQVPVVQPVDPFQGRKLDGFEGLPRFASMGDPGFEEAVDGRQVACIAIEANRKFLLIGLVPTHHESLGLVPELAKCNLQDRSTLTKR